ncbi:hypothetical protein [Sansalvadorimonas verongulae]|uniref:hypothetical protein n=1 Tax=Sansalvadorimonas verongulae TaxID=2172824 RepID=UPI0012BC2D73|nr:hypothetical protein [Sansalvadorimonas verongulae]MTI14998.1 hypothetical protein [Sansalvadorimonas verongulae]
MLAAPVIEQFVTSLEEPYGFERSMKLRSGQLVDDRWLMSLHKLSLGSDPEQGLLRLGEQLQAPAEALQSCLNALPETDVVHFGYEGGEKTVCKLYLEFASQIRELMEAGPLLQAAKVHHSLKWNPYDSSQHAFNDYWLLPESSPESLTENLLRVFKGFSSPAVIFVDRVLKRAALKNIMCLKVTEPDTGRHSYDFNLYDAELTLADIADDVYQLGSAFHIHSSRLKNWLVDNQSCELGHISTGLESDGKPFVTLYFGIEAR